MTATVLFVTRVLKVRYRLYQSCVAVACQVTSRCCWCCCWSAGRVASISIHSIGENIPRRYGKELAVLDTCNPCQPLVSLCKAASGMMHLQAAQPVDLSRKPCKPWLACPAGLCLCSIAHSLQAAWHLCGQSTWQHCHASHSHSHSQNQLPPQKHKRRSERSSSTILHMLGAFLMLC